LLQSDSFGEIMKVLQVLINLAFKFISFVDIDRRKSRSSDCYVVRNIYVTTFTNHLKM